MFCRQMEDWKQSDSVLKYGGQSTSLVDVFYYLIAPAY